MPRVALTVTDTAQAGVAQPAVQNSDPVNDHVLPFNDGRVIIEAANTSGTPRLLTIATPGTQGGLGIADQDITIPATTGVRIIGPLAPGLFNQPDGTVNIDVDGAASDVKFRVYHLA